jgi:hypothetical protein
MSRREEELEKLNKLARISEGFGGNFSLRDGIVVGADDYYCGADQGAKGLVIPWMGCKHIKILVGAD